MIWDFVPNYYSTTYCSSTMILTFVIADELVDKFLKIYIFNPIRQEESCRRSGT